MTPRQRQVYLWLESRDGEGLMQSLVSYFRPQCWCNHETLGTVAELVALGLVEKRRTPRGNEIRLTVAGRALCGT